MMTLRNLLLAFGVAATLAACSFGEGDGRSTQEGKDLEELARQRSELSVIVGTWSGTLVAGTTRTDVELTIDSLPDNSARNQDGQIVPRLQPVARLRSTNVILYDTTFVGRYFRTNGKLVFERRPDAAGDTGSASAAAGVEQLKTLELNVQGSAISGEAFSPKGPVGFLNLTLQSRQTDIPEEGEDNRNNELLRRQYAKATGIYTSTIMRPPGRDPFGIKLNIVVEDVINDRGTKTPTLKAIHTRSTDVSEILRLNLTGVYDARTNPPTINFSGSSGSRYYVNITGRFGMNPDGSTNFNIINARQTSNLGTDGDMVLTRISGPANEDQVQQPTPVPEDQPVPVPTPRPRRP